MAGDQIYDLIGLAILVVAILGFFWIFTRGD